MDKILFDIISLMHKFVVSDKKMTCYEKDFFSYYIIFSF